MSRLVCQLPIAQSSFQTANDSCRHLSLISGSIGLVHYSSLITRKSLPLTTGQGYWSWRINPTFVSFLNSSKESEDLYLMALTSRTETHSKNLRGVSFLRILLQKNLSHHLPMTRRIRSHTVFRVHPRS